jgi:tetratricopeptide (TPR) repeat protein
MSMAKQRRPSSRSTKPQALAPSRRLSALDPAAGAQRGIVPSTAPQHRSTYFEAVAVYERELLESVLRLYPEEKELHERVRLYLNICQRQATPRETSPQTVDERLYAATLAINGGQYDQAIAHLRLVRDEDPDNDHALYMLAVAHAQRQEPTEAVAHLERAIALNGENRALARTDPDLEPLRDDEAFRAALEAPPLPPRPADRRRPIRAKSAR